MTGRVPVLALQEGSALGARRGERSRCHLERFGMAEAPGIAYDQKCLGEPSMVGLCSLKTGSRAGEST
jgi:hypothetical protein